MICTRDARERHNHHQPERDTPVFASRHPCLLLTLPVLVLHVVTCCRDAMFPRGAALRTKKVNEKRSTLHPSVMVPFRLFSAFFSGYLARWLLRTTNKKVDGLFCSTTNKKVDAESLCEDHFSAVLGAFFRVILLAGYYGLRTKKVDAESLCKNPFLAVHFPWYLTRWLLRTTNEKVGAASLCKDPFRLFSALFSGYLARWLLQTMNEKGRRLQSTSVVRNSMKVSTYRLGPTDFRIDPRAFTLLMNIYIY